MKSIKVFDVAKNVFADLLLLLLMLLLQHQSRQSLSYVIDVEYKARYVFSSIFQ